MDRRDEHIVCSCMMTMSVSALGTIFPYSQWRNMFLVSPFCGPLQISLHSTFASSRFSEVFLSHKCVSVFRDCDWRNEWISPPISAAFAIVYGLPYSKAHINSNFVLHHHLHTAIRTPFRPLSPPPSFCLKITSFGHPSLSPTCSVEKSRCVVL